MKAVLALLAVVLASGQAAPVHAQAKDGRAAERRATLAGRPPWAGFVTGSTGRMGWNVVNFYVVGDPSRGEPGVYARRAHGTLAAGVTSVGWADARTCPALKPAMLAINHLRAPAIEVPPLERRTGPVRVPEIFLDGVTYGVWGEGRSEDGGSLEVEMSTNDPESPLARWVETTLKSTASCWSSVEP